MYYLTGLSFTFVRGNKDNYWLQHNRKLTQWLRKNSLIFPTLSWDVRFNLQKTNGNHFDLVLHFGDN